MNRERLDKFLKLLIVLVVLFLSTDGINNNFLVRFIGDSNIKIPLFLGMVIILTIVGTEFIKYLNKDIGKDNPKKNSLASNYDALKNEVSLLRQKIEQIALEQRGSNNAIKLSDAEQKELIEGAKKKIAGKLIIDASEALKKEIQNIREQVNINEHYEDMVIRIKNEIDRLNRRGGSNLGIGSIIALVGMGYLGYTVANQPSSHNIVEYIAHMVPRISFVLVIEIFAYFFLKLYRNGFDEVKYFQNELTNIEAKVLAIKFLRDVKNEELMSEVIKSLMTTERNFVLSRGQTTVALEKEKIKGNEDRNIISIAKELIKFKSSS